MDLKLRGNYLSQHFGKKGKVGDGPVVGNNFWVQRGFSGKCSDDSSFQFIWRTSVIIGLTTLRFEFSNAVGKASRAQADDDVLNLSL